MEMKSGSFMATPLKITSFLLGLTQQEQHLFSNLGQKIGIV